MLPVLKLYHQLSFSVDCDANRELNIATKRNYHFLQVNYFCMKAIMSCFLIKCFFASKNTKLSMIFRDCGYSFKFGNPTYMLVAVYLLYIAIFFIRQLTATNVASFGK